MMITRIFLLSFLAILISCCNNRPKDVADVINSSKHRNELEAVIDYYKAKKDPLMLQAAYFLIGNMKDKHGISYNYTNLKGESGFHFYLDAVNYSNLSHILDSIAIKDPSYKWRNEGVYDKDIITAENLIETIDYSFKVWREMPWAAKLTFPEFCEYILPYRVSNEPFSNWRKKLYHQYKWVLDSVKDRNNPVEACTLINREMAKWFAFHVPLVFAQGKRSVIETETYKLGTCIDISTYATSAMRAIGIPVAIDFTPAWADRSNGHNWNVVFPSSGNPIRFNAADINALPGAYNMTAKMAKTFRFTFQNQKESLPQEVLMNSTYKDVHVPPQLNISNAIDVTELYNNVTDCKINLSDKDVDNDIAYLSVYNLEKWKPVSWSFVKDNGLNFKNMGVNILYLQTLDKNNNSSSSSVPIIITSEKAVRKLVCNHDSLIDLIATAHNIVIAYNFVSVPTIESKKDYELYYWDKKWERHSVFKAGESQITFKNVPSNSLYKIQCSGINSQYTRPFTYDNGKQVFW